MIIQLSGQWETKDVWLDCKMLNPAESQKVRNHSPDGFNWGYGGSGPAQLALAVMLEVYEQKHAISVYQDFKWNHIAKLPKRDFHVFIDITEFENKLADQKGG